VPQQRNWIHNIFFHLTSTMINKTIKFLFMINHPHGFGKIICIFSSLCSCLHHFNVNFSYREKYIHSVK